MLNFLIALLGIFITIILIVGTHEFGHFIVARMLGIKVVCFSIGFGKALFRWRGKSGTEYVFAAIPLGGYVKMLDETGGNVALEDAPFAFNRQPLYKKAAVVLAGPLTNFLLAFLLYWTIFMLGFTTVVPIIGEIVPHSIAAEAGLKPQEEISTINNIPTPSWTAIVMRLLIYFGDAQKIPIETKKIKTGFTNHYFLDIAYWHMDPLKPDPLTTLGIVPHRPQVLPIIGQLKPNTPAAYSKLKIGDKILLIENIRIQSWYQIAEIIAKHPEETLSFTLERTGKRLIIPVKIGYARDLFLRKIGFLGFSPPSKLEKTLFRTIQYGPIEALSHAAQNTIDYTELNFLLLGKMITGKVSLKSLGGPITIFENAGASLTFGLLPFLSFLAFFSIAIGAINIVPLPGLDGGHLLIYIIEGVLGRPLAQNIQLLYYRIGLIGLLLLIMQAIANDIARL